MAFNPNVRGTNPAVKKDAKDPQFLTLSRRNQEGLSNSSIYDTQKTQSAKSIEGKNVFGQDEAQGINQDVQMFAQEEKPAEEYIQEDEQGNVSFDEASFYDDAWGISLGNSSAATDPIKASSSKSQEDVSSIKNKLTNLIKGGKTNTEIESAKDELQSQGVSSAEIATIEEDAQKDATKASSSKTSAANNQTTTSSSSSDSSQAKTGDSATTSTTSTTSTTTGTSTTSTTTYSSELSKVNETLGFTSADTKAIEQYAIDNPGQNANSGTSGSAKATTEKKEGFFTAANAQKIGTDIGTQTSVQLGVKGTTAALEKTLEVGKEWAGFGGDADVKEAEKALETEKSKLEDLNSDKEKAMKDNSAAKEYDEAKAEYDSAKATNEEETTKEKEWNTNKEKTTKNLETAKTEQASAQSHYDQCSASVTKLEGELASIPEKKQDGSDNPAYTTKKNELETAKKNKELAYKELTEKQKAKETAQTEADKYNGENPHTKPREESANKMQTAGDKMNAAKTEANKVKSGTTDAIDKINTNITKQKAAVSKAEKSLTAAKKKAEENKKKEEKK